MFRQLYYNPLHRRARSALVAFSDRIRWSILAKVGSAPAMKLTILVPFLGTLLLFNQELERLVSWPYMFRDSFPGVEEQTPQRNLYFTYFGLCFLGFASMIFAAFCPREVAEEPNIVDYTNSTPSMMAPVIAKGDLSHVLGMRFSGPDCLEDSDKVDARLDYPDTLKGEFDRLMARLYEAADLESADDVPDVLNAAGYEDFTDFARVVSSNIRSHWHITMPVYDAAAKCGADIAYLKHRSLDFSRFFIRSIIALFYGVGFALLLKPTIHVFIIVISSIF